MAAVARERVTVTASADRFQQIDLFGFRLSRTGIAPIGKKPSEAQWQQLGDYLAWAEHATPWLIGAWLEYGREAFGEQVVDQIVGVTGFQLETITQYGWVHEKVAPADRDPELSFSHHRAVADMKPSMQRALLRQAKSESLSVKELQRKVKLVKDLAKGEAAQADTTCWILVQCRSLRDRERFAAQMEKDGRSIKIP